MRQFVVTYENGQPSGTHIRDAMLFAESVCNRSNLSGLANSVHTTELQDGSIVRVQVLNDVVRVHIELSPVQLHGDEESDEYSPIETEEYKIISFASGAASVSTPKGGLFIDDIYPVQGKLKTGDLFNQNKLLKKIGLHSSLRHQTTGLYSHQTVFTENELASSDAYVIGATFIYNTVAQNQGWSVTAFKFLDDGTVVYGGYHIGYGMYYLLIGSKAKEKFSYSMIDEEYTTPPTARQVFPGKYTGNMRPLVQLLMGVGCMFETKDFFDLWLQATKQPPPSSLTLSLVDNASKEVYFTCDTVDVPSIANFKDNAMFKAIDIRFDYRWHKTHGIMWGRRNVTNDLIRACDGIAWLAPFCADPQRDEEPFLVEIGYRGVYVAPLFRDIASFFDEVRDLYKRVYPEIETYRPFKLGTATLFEALGGFPLNDCFPIDQSILDRWCRSGYVVKADVDLSDFYADGNYYESISHGWAFADTANEAANITISRLPKIPEMPEVPPRCFSKCYKLTFDIQYNDFASRVNPNGLALLHIFKFRDYCDYIKALLLPDAVIDQIISTASSNLDAAQQIFDDYIVEPIFSVVVDKVVEEEGYFLASSLTDFPIEYQTESQFNYPISPTLRLWDDVLDNVKLFDHTFFWRVLGKVGREGRIERIEPIYPAPVYVTYINDKLYILMIDRFRLKWEVESDLPNPWIDDPSYYSLFLKRNTLSRLFYVADSSPVLYKSPVYLTDREIRPTVHGLLSSTYITEYASEIGRFEEYDSNGYLVDGYIKYQVTRVINHYEPIVEFNGFFVQAANDRSVLFACLYTIKDLYVDIYEQGIHFVSLRDSGISPYKYQGDNNDRYIVESKIVVYGLPDLDGTVLSAKNVTANRHGKIKDTFFYYISYLGSVFRTIFSIPREEPAIYNFPSNAFSTYWSAFVKKQTYLIYNTPPKWFVAYNYYGAPYFATNVDWGSDQLYVKGSLTVAHVPVNAMFFGIVT